MKKPNTLSYSPVQTLFTMRLRELEGERFTRYREFKREPTAKRKAKLREVETRIDALNSIRKDLNKLFRTE